MDHAKQHEEGLLANVIAEQLKHKIQSMEYKAGDRLPVRKLCEDFNTSETPVKQALNQLAATGLVAATPKCGMRVRTFTFSDMKNVLEARLMIEQFCARDAVLRVRRDADYADLMRGTLEESDRCYRRCIESFTKENFIRAHETDGKLHSGLVGASQNPEIVNLYRTLNTHAGMFTSFEKHTPQTLQQVIRQHDDIVGALLLCDTDGLRGALERHLRSTLQILGGNS